MQVSHGNGGVGVRDGPVVERDLSTDSATAEFTGAVLNNQIFAVSNDIMKLNNKELETVYCFSASRDIGVQ